MPDEINRLCTDVLCDYRFTNDHFANEKLIAEGKAEDKIVFIGNVMIETLLNHRELAAGLNVTKKMGLISGEYSTLKMHRPSNVDDRKTLKASLGALHEISQILSAADRVLDGAWNEGGRPEKWDGYQKKILIYLISSVL